MMVAVWLLVAAAGQPSAALVVIHPTQGDGPAREAARSELSSRFELLEDSALRAVLEGEVEQAPLRDAQAALAQARQSIRRFDMESARRSLSLAREKIGAVPPTSEARALAMEIAVREAELELVEGRPAEATRHLGAALSIDPALSLDPELYAPPIIEQLRLTRAQRERAPKLTVKVESVPSGARLVAAGIERCCTPLAVELSKGPQVLWLQRDRYRPTLLRLVVASAGPVSVPLAPESKAQRIQPLVEALRAGAASDLPQAAAALREELGVDALAVLDPSGVRTYERPRAPPPSIAEAPTAAPGVMQRRWPVLVAAAVAAGLAAGGAAAGASASQQAQRADALSFASDGQAQWNEGARTATVANALWAGAGVAGAAGVVFFFVF